MSVYETPVESGPPGQPEPVKLSSARIAVIRASNGLRPVSFSEVDVTFPESMQKFNFFWDMMDALYVHGYTSAAMSIIGRAVVGSGWALRKHDEYKNKAKELHRRKLMDFYSQTTRKWDNIKDFYPITYKLMIGAMYLRFFGQCAFQIVRNVSGEAIGLDFLHGFVMPHVDSRGYFKTPAFVQYPTKNPKEHVDFDNPRDIVYIVNPDWKGSPVGGTDMEALSKFGLPLDIYLQTAALQYMKNRDKPEAYYILPPDISDEAFEKFQQQLQERYSGVSNLGRNPVAVAGDLKIEELTKLPDQIPFLDTRKDVRLETLAVSGVPGVKVGVVDGATNSNFRESRREFHETSMLSLFRFLEVGLYEQVHLREFNAPGWELSFNNPDFLNAVERATVHMRYLDMGVLNPNEIRHELGRQPREGGDEYVDPTAKPGFGNGEDQGSPPEGREDRPDAPGETGEPTLDDQDPPRGDGHDEEERMLQEIQQWRKFVDRRMRRGQKMRQFEVREISPELAELIQSSLDRAATLAEKHEVFNSIEDFIKERKNGEIK